MLRMTMADRITAAVLFLIGLSMAVGGWRMDRLEIRQIHPASIPGLVPIILGILLAICAVSLWQSARRGADADDEELMAGGSWVRLAATGGLCIIYALVLVGTLPFFWATAIFVTGFALLFSWPDMKNKAFAIGISLLLGLGLSYGISVMFEQAFLVRLP